MDCLENRAAIEVWRKSLQGYQRTAWNHPTTVLRHWKKHLAREQEKARIAAGGEPKPKPPSPMAKRDEAIRNLVDEVDRLRKAPREGDLFKWGDGHERIAKVLVADALANGCSPDKIRRIDQLLFGYEDGKWRIYLLGRDKSIGGIRPTLGRSWFGQMSLDGRTTTSAAAGPQDVMDRFDSWVAACMPPDRGC